MDDDEIVMGKVIKKGEANGFEASDALAMLGTIVLNVVHGVHR